MSERQIQCPETEEVCSDGGCKQGFCKKAEAAQRLLADARKIEDEEVDAEAKKLAPEYFKGKNIANPTAEQIRKFIDNPKVREIAKQRLLAYKSVTKGKL